MVAAIVILYILLALTWLLIYCVWHTLAHDIHNLNAWSHRIKRWGFTVEARLTKPLGEYIDEMGEDEKPPPGGWLDKEDQLLHNPDSWKRRGSDERT